MLVVVSEKNADQIVTQLLSDNRAGYDITGIVLLENSNLTSVQGIPVVSDMKKVTQYIAKEWVDSVYIDAPINDRAVIRLMDACATMAVPTLRDSLRSSAEHPSLQQQLIMLRLYRSSLSVYSMFSQA